MGDGAEMALRDGAKVALRERAEMALIHIEGSHREGRKIEGITASLRSAVPLCLGLGA